MAHESFAGKVFAALVRLSSDKRNEVEVGELSSALMIQTRQQHKRMLNALSDLKKAGKVVRLQQGVYFPASEKNPRAPELRAVMWRLLRMRRRVTVDDLAELSGASREYAKDWLQMLEKRAIVRRVPQLGNQPHLWQMIKDPGAMPVDDAAADRLRALRKKKKQQALADLLTAQELIGKACQAIKEMEAGHD